MPKEIGEKLKTNTVYFEIVNDTIVVKAVEDPAGSLSKYAKNVKPGISMKQMKDRAGEVAVREKIGKKSSRYQHGSPVPCEG